MRQVVTENIRALMARRGVRQPQIMALLGLSQPAVSRRLNGQLAWDIDELEKIGIAFEVSVAELVGGTSQDPGPGSSRTTRQHDDHRLTLIAA